MNKSIIITIIIILTTLFTVSCEEEKENNNSIYNEDFDEECTEAEIQMNDGSCAYNQCEIISCGEGDCSVNRNSGAAQCACHDGYGTENTIACDRRLGRYDIETTWEIQHVPTGEQVLIAEWDIHLNEAENAMLVSLHMEISGDKNSFSNFKVGFLHPTYGNILFGETMNEATYGSNDLDDMNIRFGEAPTDAHSFALPKGEITTIRLYATVDGESGDQITAAITSAYILSEDVITSNVGIQGLPLQSDYTLGDSIIQSSVAGSGYYHQVNPLARIQ